MKLTDIVIGAVIFTSVVGFAFGIYLWWRIDSKSHTAPAPAFTCAQTISADSAAILSADLWDRASRGERKSIFFECRNGVTFLQIGES